MRNQKLRKNNLKLKLLTAVAALALGFLAIGHAAAQTVKPEIVPTNRQSGQLTPCCMERRRPRL